MDIIKGSNMNIHNIGSDVWGEILDGLHTTEQAQVACTDKAFRTLVWNRRTIQQVEGEAEHIPNAILRKAKNIFNAPFTKGVRYMQQPLLLQCTGYRPTQSAARAILYSTSALSRMNWLMEPCMVETIREMMTVIDVENLQTSHIYPKLKSLSLVSCDTHIYSHNAPERTILAALEELVLIDCSNTFAILLRAPNLKRLVYTGFALMTEYLPRWPKLEHLVIPITSIDVKRIPKTVRTCTLIVSEMIRMFEDFNTYAWTELWSWAISKVHNMLNVDALPNDGLITKIYIVEDLGTQSQTPYAVQIKVMHGRYYVRREWRPWPYDTDK